MSILPPVKKMHRSSSEARYMDPKKNRYYLASTDQNLESLRKEQIEDLTRVLIGLKSELDSLVCHRSSVLNETEDMVKKKEIIEQMDKILKKSSLEIRETNDNMKQLIDIKKGQLQEVIHEKRTLQVKLAKLKDDILIYAKCLKVEENNNEILKQKLQKEKLNENDVKEKYNQVFSQILDQQKMYNFNKNEYDLQLKYYNTIIDKKLKFIQSADERKERQKRIALEAKNESNDQHEIDKRRTLQLLYLADQFYNKKISKNLNKNAHITDVFQQIRDIAGTSSMTVIVDKILSKDKKYNMLSQQILDKQQRREQLLKDVKRLRKEFNKLKGDILIKELDNK